MKEKMISKIILVLIMLLMLTAMPINAFATSDGATDLNDFWEDQTTDLQPETPETTNPEPTTPTTPTNPETQKPTQAPEDTYSHAGVAEDTMMVILVLALITLAVFANKKVNEYKNI